MKIILKRFTTTSNDIISTRGQVGFRQNKDGSYRKYDTDFDRLGRGSVQREISIGPRQLSEEIKETRKDLNGVSVETVRKELKFGPNAMNNEIKELNNELNRGRLRNGNI